MRSELILITATILAAIGWIASKLVIQGMANDMFIALRFLTASLLLLPFSVKQLAGLPLKLMAKTAGVGLMLALSIQIWLYAVSISDTLAEGAFIMSLAMIFAPMIATLLFKTRLNKAFVLAFPIALCGLMLLMLENGWHIDPSQIYFLLASLFLSFHFVLNKQIASKIKPIASITIQLFVVGCSGLASMLVSDVAEFNPNAEVLLWFVVSVVAATAIRYLIQTVGQATLNGERAALIMLLEPIWTLMLSVVMLGEVLSAQQLLGGMVILFSLVVYIKQPKA